MMPRRVSWGNGPAILRTEGEVMKVRMAGITPESVVDGPGIRLVFFTQGCPHNCEGCQNPATHDPNGGSLMDTADLIDSIEKAKLIRGITFSGGEPFLQAAALLEVAQAAKAKKLSVVAYSGYCFEELQKNAEAKALLEYIDLLIDGPFVLAKRDLKLPFRGSSNQRLIDVQSSFKTGKTVLQQEAIFY